MLRFCWVDPDTGKVVQVDGRRPEYDTEERLLWIYCDTEQGIPANSVSVPVITVGAADVEQGTPDMDQDTADQAPLNLATITESIDVLELDDETLAALTDHCSAQGIEATVDWLDSLRQQGRLRVVQGIGPARETEIAAALDAFAVS